MKCPSRLIAICLLLTINSFAGKLEKGFERLKVFDYFQARELFEKSIDDDPAAAAYGLSLIYSANNNPFYSTDTARSYILIADSVFPGLKDKTKKYYAEFGVSDSAIKSLNEFICLDAFNNAKKAETVAAFNNYLKRFIGCPQFSEAALLRDAAAFNDARRLNTSVAYKEFMAAYPQAEQYKQAQSKFDERVYEENTDGSIESYEYFLQNFPENPYRRQAEKMIYTLSTPNKKNEQYVAFARKYKDSHFSEEAWHEVYKLSMKDFSEESFNQFKTTYPDYPFPEELETDFRLQNYVFLPYNVEGKWGYINESGQEMIKPQYDEASFFSEGLAVVSTNGKYGYINKAGKTIIALQFDDAESFHNLGAVIMKDSLYGLINKSGEILIQPVYEELSEVSDEIYMAVRDELSGYVNRNGVALTEFVFDVANEFQNGYAIVSKKEKFGLVNAGGGFNIEPKFEELVFISNNLLKAMDEDDMWGVINIQGDTILPFAYEAIGEFSEHFALIVKKEKVGYIDEKGVEVIPINYRYTPIMLSTAQFIDGYAWLKQKLKSIIIDTTGKSVNLGIFEDYGRPSQNLVPVKRNRKWGFADMTGKVKIPCKYENVEPFHYDFALIRQNKMAGLIDTSGAVLISPLYEDIIVTEKSIMVRSSGKNGLLSRAGILLVPCSYDKIEFLTNSIARASNANGFTYVNLSNGRIIFNSQSE